MKDHLCHLISVHKSPISVKTQSDILIIHIEFQTVVQYKSTCDLNAITTQTMCLTAVEANVKKRCPACVCPCPVDRRAH